MVSEFEKHVISAGAPSLRLLQGWVLFFSFQSSRMSHLLKEALTNKEAECPKFRFLVPGSWGDPIFFRIEKQKARMEHLALQTITSMVCDWKKIFSSRRHRYYPGHPSVRAW
jgi:hypothetical protein